MLQFHHIKYKELHGYDEVELIEHYIHSNITKNSGEPIPKDILKKSSIRLSYFRGRPHSEFYGAFCIIKKCQQKDYNHDCLINEIIKGAIIVKQIEERKEKAEKYSILKKSQIDWGLGYQKNKKKR